MRPCRAKLSPDGILQSGCKKPTAYNIPSSLPDIPLDLFKHVRIQFFDPLIVYTAGTGELKIREILHPVQRTAKSGRDLRETLLPAPQPHRIQMSISYQMNFRHVQILHIFSCKVKYRLCLYFLNFFQQTDKCFKLLRLHFSANTQNFSIHKAFLHFGFTY